MANADYTSLGPPPLATPITLNGDDHGIPFQDRGVPRGDLQVGWAQWFNKIWTRMVVLLDAVLGAANLTHTGAIPKVSSAGTLTESAINDNGTFPSIVYVVQRAVLLDNNFGLQAFDSGGTGRTVILLDSANPDVLHIRNNQRAAGGTINLESMPGGAVGASVDNAGNVNAAASYRVAGTRVVTARQPAITPPSISTSNTASTAGATYTATEQGMLNQFKTSIGQLNTDVGNLQSAVNSLISTLQTHGLTS